MSHRFALKRFLGLSEDEIAENERMWSEEQGEGSPTATDSGGELRGAGLSAGGIAGDLGMAGDLTAPDDMAPPGATTAPAPGTAPTATASPPPAA